MHFEEYTLNHSFESIGMWTPDYKQLDAAVTGVLSVAEGKYLLKLFGFTNQFENKRMIYGYTEDGKLIWIPNFRLPDDSKSESRFAVTSIAVEEFYLFDVNPEHFKGSNIIADAFTQIFQNSRFDFQVHQLSFSTNYLLEWMGQQAYNFAENKNGELHIPYGTVKSEQYQLPKQLMLQFDLKQSISQKETGLYIDNTAEVCIHKQDKTKIWFKNAYKEALSIVKLMDFLGGWINEFTFLHFDINPGIRGSYIFQQNHTTSDYTEQEVHTTFQDLDYNMEKVLLNYMAKRNKLDLVLDDYLSEFYLVEFYETKLLNSIRTLEIFHRNFIEPRERISTDEGMDAAREQIIRFINNDVAEEYQGRFRSQVYYQPEKSLRKRMDYLIKNLPDDVFDLLQIKMPKRRKSRSIGSFVNRLIETRHYYTHGDNPEHYPSRIVELDQIKHVNRVMRKICLYYVYKELGITEDLILRKLR